MNKSKSSHLLKVLSIFIFLIIPVASFVLIFHSVPAAAYPSQPQYQQQVDQSLTTPPEIDIAILDDSNYVDNDGTGEADNLRATLTQLGHTATTFTGITAADFTNAIAGKDILIIPELENGDLGTDLTIAARGVISDFVTNGGGVIVFGSQSESNPATEDHAPSFLNQVFDFSITSRGVLPNSSNPANTDAHLNELNSQDTTFYDDIDDLNNFSGVQFLVVSSLPPSSKAIYDTAFGEYTSVFLTPHGTGQIIYLGQDWFNIQPNGLRDGGWLDVLDSALHQLIPPNLVVEKQSSASIIKGGERITYTVTFSNAGGAGGGITLADIVLTDSIPNELQNVSYTSSGVTITETGGSNFVWDVVNMLPGRRGVITVTATVDSNVASGTIFTNTATITGTNDTDNSNNTSEVGVMVSGQNLYLPVVTQNN